MSAASSWWRSAVVYQVYLRSFADGNGDGVGDLTGLRARIPYLVDLGVDAIWLNPWYRSPMRDGGYDVADYRQIDPRFGTLADAESFVADAHAAGLRVVVDLVPNHTSSDHDWFAEAVAAGPGAPARERYHFRAGRGVDGAEPPTDWPSVFGGPAWSRLADGEWYLHLFDPSQPDLNWSHPDVIVEFEEILRFWLDRGIDGFRVDVAHGLVKDPHYTDLAGRSPHVDVSAETGHPYWDRDELHDIARRWRAVLDDYDDRMMVAEASVHATRRPLYVRPDEFHQAFDFDLLAADWNAKQFAEVIRHAVAATAAVGSTPTWVLSNHDVMRHATRYGLPNGVDTRSWAVEGPHELLDAARGARRARAAALIELALPGSAYLYQGDELGLPEVWDLPVEVLDDPVWVRSGGKEKGRDGCRVPIPWTPDRPSFGFSTGTAWLPQPDAFGEHSVARQLADATSTLALYRRALATRRLLLDDDEQLEVMDGPADVLRFRRSRGFTCIANMGDDPVVLPPGDVVLGSVEIGDDRRLPPDEAVWLR
ncbi:MAG: alpha-amylase family glycosyl hydrolase [Ilumatobacteraceae bacterium]